MNIWKPAHFVTSVARKDPEYNMPLVRVNCYFQTDIEISNPNGLLVLQNRVCTLKSPAWPSVSSNWPNWPSRATITLTWNELLPHTKYCQRPCTYSISFDQRVVFIIPFYMRKLRHREVKRLAQRMWLLSGRVDYEPRQSDPELLVWAITLPGLRVLMPRGKQQGCHSRTHSLGETGHHAPNCLKTGSPLISDVLSILLSYACFSHLQWELRHLQRWRC